MILRSPLLKLSKLVLILLAFSQANFYGQERAIFNWAGNIGGGSQDFAEDMTIDGQGNTYITGVFSGTADFDPGSSTFNLTAVDGADAFVVKLNVLGNLVWAKQIGGTLTQTGNTVDVDHLGNVYVAGAFQGNTDFDPGSGTSSLNSVGSSDGFILKLDSSGGFEWVVNFGGATSDQVNDIDIDGNGDVYGTGFFSNTVDFDPGFGVHNMTSTAGAGFVWKISSSGSFVYAKQFGSSITYGNGIVLDASNNIHITGLFQGMGDFDPGVSTANITNVGANDIFILKLNALGNYIWVSHQGGSSAEESYSIDVDGNGNVYTVGYFAGTVDFNPGVGDSSLTVAGSGSDIFISKLDALGDFVWVRQLGGMEDDRARSVKVGNSGNIYTTGGFKSTVDFDPGVGVYNLTSQGAYETFVSCLDNSGNFKWATQVHGSGNDQGYAVSLNPFGEICVVGYFFVFGDFDPSSASFNLSSAGSSDAFIWKLDQCYNSVGSISETMCDSYTSPSGNHIWTSSGVYSDTIVNVSGCDSIITINLSINNSSTTNISPISCFEYISPSGNYTWNQSGNFSDTISNSVGCDSIISFNLTINTVDTSITSNSGMLTANQATASYQWLDCNNGFSSLQGETGQSFTASSNGDYAVMITNNGCIDTSFCYNITNVGMDEQSISNLKIYPNPVEDFLYAEIGTEVKGYTYSILTAQGKVVLDQKKANDSFLIIDLHECPVGLFFLKLELEDKVLFRPLLKH